MHENRHQIFEEFIKKYYPYIDRIIAPHGTGNQITIRSQKALNALKFSIPK